MKPFLDYNWIGYLSNAKLTTYIRDQWRYDFWTFSAPACFKRSPCLYIRQYFSIVLCFFGGVCSRRVALRAVGFVLLGKGQALFSVAGSPIGSDNKALSHGTRLYNGSTISPQSSGQTLSLIFEVEHSLRPYSRFRHWSANDFRVKKDSWCLLHSHPIRLKSCDW